MNLFELVDNTIQDTTAQSLPAFGPELILCLTIFLILIVRIVPRGDKLDSFYLALFGLVAALTVPWGGQPWAIIAGPDNFPRTEIFGGMLVYDGFTAFMRGILMVSAILVVVLTKLTKLSDRDSGPDFYTLILGATLGMCLMASANHLLMIFLAVEMASVPSYVLAGMLKHRRDSSEAALKYSIYGAGAAGVMLYGISLVASTLNTAHMPTMAAELADKLATMPAEQQMVLVLAGLMIMVGLAFKLSAVPFHFWCPDVFEGASAEIGAFLSVSSKAAALALLVRVAVGFGIVPAGSSDNSPAARPNQIGILADESRGQRPLALFSVANRHDDRTGVPATPGAALAPVRGYIAGLIALIAVITCTFGNLAAYGQTNIKRLLAYSTIAHAGYMMMPVPAAMALAGQAPALAEKAVASLAIYMGIYLFMNLGAFAIVAFLRNALQSEQIADYAGLVRQCPGVVVCFSIILFSLIGLPPLAGFVGKFAIFAALVRGYEITGSALLMVLFVVGCVNTAISLFYYLRVVRVMTIEPEPEGRKAIDLRLESLAGAYIVVITAPTLLLLLSWNWLSNWALSAARHLLS